MATSRAELLKRIGVPEDVPKPTRSALVELIDAPLELHQRAYFAERAANALKGSERSECGDIQAVFTAHDALNDAALAYAIATTTTADNGPAWLLLLDCARALAKAETDIDQGHKLEDALDSTYERVANGASPRSAICEAAFAVGADAEALARDWLFFHGSGAEPQGVVR